MFDNYVLYSSFNQIVIEEKNSYLSNVYLKHMDFKQTTNLRKLKKYLKRANKIAKSISNYYTYDAYKLLDTINVIGFIEQLSNHHYYVKHIITHKKNLKDIVVESVVYKRTLNNKIKVVFYYLGDLKNYKLDEKKFLRLPIKEMECPQSFVKFKAKIHCKEIIENNIQLHEYKFKSYKFAKLFFKNKESAYKLEKCFLNIPIFSIKKECVVTPINEIDYHIQKIIKLTNYSIEDKYITSFVNNTPLKILDTYDDKEYVSHLYKYVERKIKNEKR